MKFFVLVLLLGVTLTHARPTCQIPTLTEGAHVQDVICGIERVEKAMMSVPEDRLRPCGRVCINNYNYANTCIGHLLPDVITFLSQILCEPNLHNNIHIQANIVDFYREFIIREGIIAEHSHPESLTALLEVINNTLPMIRTSVRHNIYKHILQLYVYLVIELNA